MSSDPPLLYPHSSSPLQWWACSILEQWHAKNKNTANINYRAADREWQRCVVPARADSKSRHSLVIVCISMSQPAQLKVQDRPGSIAVLPADMRHILIAPCFLPIILIVSCFHSTLVVFVDVVTSALVFPLLASLSLSRFLNKWQVLDVITRVFEEEMHFFFQPYSVSVTGQHIREICLGVWRM